MQTQGLSRNTKIFSAASFLVDVSSEMVVWVLPFFLSTVLAAPVFIIGLIDALRESVAKAIGIFAGIEADKTGKRKKMVILGYSVSAMMKAFLVFATHWMHVLGIIFFERFGKGIRDAPRDALIVISEKKENIGKAFGFRRMMDTAGAMAGPLIATAILAFFLSNGSVENAYRVIFAVSLVPAVLAVLLLFFIKEEMVQKHDGKEIILGVLNTPGYKRFILASLVFALGEFSIAFFLLRAGEFAPLALIPVFGMAYNLAYASSAVPAGHLTDRVGAKRTLTLSWSVFILTLLGFAFFASMQSLFILFGMLGMFIALDKVAPSVFLSRIIPTHSYASATGIHQGVIGLAVLPANFIASALWNVELFGVSAAFLFPITTSMLAIIMLNVLVRE